MGDAMTVLALRNVSKSFGPIQVLHDVDLAPEPGEVHALIGENCAGKSTIMNILGGFLDRAPAALLFQSHRFLDQVAGDLLDVAADIADLGELGRLDLEEGGLRQPG